MKIDGVRGSVDALPPNPPTLWHETEVLTHPHINEAWQVRIEKQGRDM